ncbi:MAG: ribosomal protein S18-alanine N-acetyltransferase [Candidatus Marinimicrobia bacterium]|nr:ribosomal protein S18-alanine N-acetyltransferase [Candidatus Neomarinimicrobiota bacterium]MCH8836957.1 ribosomal protein S18-alanine N-acetyltransferase [Candidatus Neomarinimicrobiota bacterium]
MLIRQAHVEDISQLLDIEHYCYDDPWPREAFEEEIGNGVAGIGMVAEDDGIIVGFITGLTMAQELQVHNIAVHPDYQGRGIGRQLMEAVDDLGRAGDYQRISLEVRQDNDIACKLYLSLGFKAVGTRKDFYGPGQDASLYTKELTAE